MRKVLLFLMSLSPILTNAQAFSTGYAGEKQHAMGNTGAALALDAASMSYNPALMSFLDSNTNSVSIGGAIAVVNTDYLDANNNTVSETSNPFGTPFHLHFCYKIKDDSTTLSKFTFGLAIGTPYGGNLKYDRDWTGKYVVIEKKLGTVVVTPSASYKINDKLSVGVGIGIAESKLHILNGVPTGDSLSNVELDYSLRGFGFGGGVYYQLNEDISLGLGYISEVNNKSYKGTAKFDVPASIDSLFPSGNSTFESKVPHMFSLGTGYTGIEKLKIAFDINYMLWSCFDSTIFEYTEATSSSALSSTRHGNNWTDVFAFRLGAQYNVIEGVTARVGASYEITPVPSNHLYPDVPDANRINLTAGIGYNLSESLSFDLSYRFSNLMERDFNNTENGMAGTFKSYGHITGLSLNYNF